MPRPVGSAADKPVPWATISFPSQFHAAPFVVRPSTVVTHPASRVPDEAPGRRRNRAGSR
jgi:hypothetical protein